MSGKGSKRRRENTALVEANWDRTFGQHKRAASPLQHGEVEGATQAAAGQGAAMQDVPGTRADHAGDGV